MNKKLPLKINASVHTECWTYFKLSIIEAYKQGKNWLYSHMPLYVDGKGCAMFGSTENKVLGMKYFSDILTFEKVDYWAINPNEIVDTIINCLDEEKYVILYIFTPPKFKWPHEYLLFGYDKERQLFLTSLTSNNGMFREETISFDDIKKGFSTLKNWYENDKTTIEEKSNWFFLYTTISISNSNTPDWNTTEILLKLLYEANGKGYIELENFQQDEGYTSHKVFYGFSSLLGMAEHMDGLIFSKQYIDSQYFIEISDNLVRSLRKIYEYFTIIYESIKTLYLQYSSNDIYLCIKSYQQCYSRTKELYLIAIKFRETHNWDLLVNIRECMPNLYVDIKKTIMDLYLYVKELS